MTTHLFCLGREPVLSAAELLSSLSADGILFRIDLLSRRVVRVESDSLLDPPAHLDRLGGTVRIASQLAQLGRAPTPKEIAETILQNLRQRIGSLQRKVVFGLSTFGTKELDNTTLAYLREIGSLVKEGLKELDYSSRFVLPMRGAELSGAQIKQNRLLESGTEFVVVRGRRASAVGSSIATQEFEEDAHRDMDRPARPLRRGVLPPKLARIMVNLARQPGAGTLLDPFCGSGVILMEALRLGLEPLGSDSSKRSLEDSGKNLEWLKEQLPAPGKTPHQVIHCDARDLSERIAPLSIDAVATEPYLGPPLKADILSFKAATLRRELHALYVRALAEIRIVLRPGGRCVFVTPVFQTEAGPKGISLDGDLRRIGYRRLNVLNGLGHDWEDQPLIHRRPRQHLAREIHLLEA